MDKILHNLLLLYKNFIIILKEEGDEQVYFAINLISEDIINIENINNELNKVEFIRSLKKRYESMYPPRGGLSEFFIWRDDFNLRIKENKKFNKIKKDIEKIYKHIA